MFSYFMTREEAFVCNGDNHFGYYAAVALHDSGKFQKIVVGVCNRDDEYSRDLQKRGMELREWHLEDRRSVERALKGIKNVLLTIEPSNKIREHTENIIEGCKTTEVTNLVFWSSLGVEHADPQKYKHYHELAQIEEIVKRSGIQNLCVARIGFPQQMLFLLSHRIQDRGQLPLPTGRGKFAPVNLKDCGTATAEILSSSGAGVTTHKHQTYQFTGTNLVTGQKLVEHANRVLEAEIDYQDVELDEFRKILQQEAHELNEYAIECILEKMEMIKENKLAIRTDELQKIIGREPMDIETFFKENARDFKPAGGQVRRLSIADLSS